MRKNPFVEKTHWFLVMCEPELYVFEETEKSLQNIIGDYFSPGGSVKNTRASRSSHRKRMLKIVRNICNAKRAALF